MLALARLALALLSLLAAGCAELGFARASFERRFELEADSFPFANELVWIYGVDGDGSWRARRQRPAAEFTHRCFALARGARQFFQHARFEPALPPADEATTRALVREVLETSPRRRLAEGERIVIPGYANLRELGHARAPLLRQELGGPVWSYVQRGNWRLVLPFLRGGQAQTAEQLMRALDRNRPPIVHLVRFPRIEINHAVLLYAYRDEGAEVRFEAYDPNDPGAPAVLSYERATRTFRWPRNAYFRGGRVDVYELYHRPWY